MFEGTRLARRSWQTLPTQCFAILGRQLASRSGALSGWDALTCFRSLLLVPPAVPYELVGKKVWDMLYSGVTRAVQDEDVVPKQLISLLQVALWKLASTLGQPDGTKQHCLACATMDTHASTFWEINNYFEY